MKRTRALEDGNMAEAATAPAAAQTRPREPPLVERIAVGSLTPASFRERFLVPNIPVILTGTAQHWRAAREWVHPDGSPNVDFLAAAFGEAEVPVVDSGGRRSEMALCEYAAWWRSRDERLLYLKDWHFAAHHAEYGAYDTPPQFAEDWLNEHWEALRAGCDGSEDSGDHRFVYLGPRGSCTPLHADVFFSYSWSVNIAGRKQWLLVPAAERQQVSDAATSPLSPDLAGLPSVKCIALEQEPGEALFVPSGWYHQVLNMTDCLSINHNWINAANANWPVVRLAETCEAVRQTLGDDASDEELCAQMLRRRCGMDLSEYMQLLSSCIHRRLPVLLRSAVGAIQQAMEFMERTFDPEDLELSRRRQFEKHRRTIRQGLLIADAAERRGV